MRTRSLHRITADGIRRSAGSWPLVVMLAAVFTSSAVPRRAVFAEADHPASAQWVGTWSASPQSGFFASDFNNRTLRMMIHASIGGDRVRVRLSNAFGTTPLVVSAAHIAIRSAGAAIVAGTDRPVSFSGHAGVRIPPGALVISDAITLTVPPLSDVAVSIFLNGNTGPATSHNVRGVSYLATGDVTGSDAAPYTAALGAWLFLGGVEVRTASSADAIVALGDSITDGDRSTPDTNRRWPDELARRLTAAHSRHAVLNAGIAGNRIFTSGFGLNALARFDSDVLAQTGVRFAVVLEGINDIGTSSPAADVSADDIIFGLRQLAIRGHSRHITMIAATMTPFEGAALPGYYSVAGEMKRQAVNSFIRTTRTFDGVIDFDKAIRDPGHPSRLLPIYDSGDHLHPSDAGYKAMGDAIDLSLFRNDEEEDR